MPMMNPEAKIKESGFYGMTVCPVCGYDPNPIETPLSEAELRHNRLLSAFQKNLQNTWWLSQPLYIMNWLANLGINPKTVLDVGCGDGRFYPAVSKIWPAAYSGLDAMPDHISINRENFPETEWLCADVCSYPHRHFDLVLLMGIFNPLRKKEDQEAIIDWVKAESPRDVACLFDLNSTGVHPCKQLLPEYPVNNILIVPKSECGFMQNLICWRFRKNI